MAEKARSSHSIVQDSGWRDDFGYERTDWVLSVSHRDHALIVALVNQEMRVVEIQYQSRGLLTLDGVVLGLGLGLFSGHLYFSKVWAMRIC